MSSTASAPDPALILDLLEAFRRSKTMFAAVALGVFDALAAGPKPLTELAAELKADSDALERLLGACVGLKLLQFAAGRYENTPIAATYLCLNSDRRLTGYIGYSNTVMWRLWEKLEDAVREGSNRWKQVYGWEGPIFSHFFRTEEARREFLMGMHGFGLISSPQVVAAFDLNRFNRLVDLGGATGHLAVAACERYPKMHGVVFDLAEAIPLAREIVAKTSVAARVEFAAGDFFSDPLPAGDLFAVGRILHDWSLEKIEKLLTRVFDRLPAGGALLIAEKLLNNDQSGPRWAQMQNLNMLTCTEGKERTLAQYEALLREVGFATVEGRATPSPLDAVLAVKN
jgi:acetylserotonin N-methyltransferase